MIEEGRFPNRSLKKSAVCKPPFLGRDNPAMEPDPQTKKMTRAAGEEILRLIYGDDLEGCTVSLDRITEVIADTVTAHGQVAQAIADLHQKGFEAIQLLSTPPPNGPALGADELRSLLGERLDKIQGLATKVIAATKVEQETSSDL
jgi:hypothetical protein